MTVLAAPHQHGSHGNPADLDAYIAKMEDPGRAAWQKPDEVLRLLAPRAGEVLCDIGAGPGYFALRAAKSYAHVYAIDVEPKIVSVLRDRLDKQGVKNVSPILASPDDPLLPPVACDVVLIVDTFHHFNDGVAYLRRLARSLRPGGRIVNIDFHKRELPVGPRIDHKIAREEFIALAKKAELEVTAEHSILPHQYFLVLMPKTKPAPQ